jgi:hypothetical protein
MGTDLPGELEVALAGFRHSSEAVMTDFMRPWGNSPAPPMIYHYTDDAGLKGILESGRVWLNDLFQMNDPSELRHGVEHAIELAKAMAQSFGPEMEFFARHIDAIRENGIERSAHYFVVSFSKNGDELGNWRAYADDGHGFALGFDGSSFEQGFASGGGITTEGKQTFSLIYDDKELRAVQEQIVALVEPLMKKPTGRGFADPVLREYLGRLTVEFAVHIFHSSLYFKHHAYRAEDEYRFLSIQRGDRPPARALFRPKPYGLIRYVEYDWRAIAPGALQKIVIGPAADEAKARAFVNTCLSVFGFDQTSG